jgi:hypothetical protein
LNECLSYEVLAGTTFFNDELPFAEDNYYWVMAINNNGTSYLSQFVGLQ